MATAQAGLSCRVQLRCGHARSCLLPASHYNIVNWSLEYLARPRALHGVSMSANKFNHDTGLGLNRQQGLENVVLLDDDHDGPVAALEMTDPAIDRCKCPLHALPAPTTPVATQPDRHGHFMSQRSCLHFPEQSSRELCSCLHSHEEACATRCDAAAQSVQRPQDVQYGRRCRTRLRLAEYVVRVLFVLWSNKALELSHQVRLLTWQPCCAACQGEELHRSCGHGSEVVSW